MNRHTPIRVFAILVAAAYTFGVSHAAAEEVEGHQAGHAAPKEQAAHGPEGGGAGHAAAEHEVSSPFAGALINSITTIVIFVLLLVVLGKFAWGPILTALQKREEFIQNSLDQAKKDRQEAEANLRALTERLNKARDEASSIVEAGRRDAEAVRRDVETQARTEADAMVDRAKREIGTARDAAVRDLYESAADMATEIATRIIRKEISGTDHQRMIQESLDELRKLQEGGTGYSGN